MPKGKDTVPEEEVSNETTLEEVLTVEQKLEQAESKITDYEGEMQKSLAEQKRLDDGYKGLQTKYNKTFEDLKRQSDVRVEIDDLKKYIKILAAQQAEIGVTKEDIDGMTPNKQQDYVKRFEDMEQQAETRRKDAEQKSVADDYNKRADDVYARAEKVYEDDADSLFQIRQYLRSSDIDLAEKKITQIEKKSEVTVKEKETKQETDDQIFERIAKEKGLLKTDTVLTSGRSKSFDDVHEAYGKGEIGTKEYMEAREKEGIH